MIYKVNPEGKFNLDSLKTHVCIFPYLQFQVYDDGGVEVCCRSWMRKEIGNFNTQTAEEVLSSPILEHIVKDMEEGKWSYCTDYCPNLVSFLSDQVRDVKQPVNVLDNSVTKPEKMYINRNWKKAKLTEEKITKYTTITSKTSPSWLKRKAKGDYVIIFNHDRSCNLQCPSCRNEFIHVLASKDPEGFAKLTKVQKRIEDMVEILLKKEDADTVALNITGSGDPFASDLYWNYLLELNEKVLLPEYSKLRIKLQTNGVLMTPERMEKIKNLWNKIEWISISIDAMTVETYTKIRKRGNLESVMKNVHWLNEKVESLEIGSQCIKRDDKDKIIEYMPWNVNFIVQSDNYKEMADFAKYYAQYKTIYSVWFNPIADWGHLKLVETDLFAKKAIWLKEHPEHEEFVRIIRDPIFDNEKMDVGSLAAFRLKPGLQKVKNTINYT